jgi:hypothetical protein
MNKIPRRRLQVIPPRADRSGTTQNPQRRFLRVASLELKRSLCAKVRDAARKRAEEMDRKIAELEAEKAQLLAGDPTTRLDAGRTTLREGPPPDASRCFTFRY